MTVKKTGTDKVDSITRDWFYINGYDHRTGVNLEGEYAVTSENKILDCDGAPLTEGDYETIAVRNAIGKGF